LEADELDRLKSSFEFPFRKFVVLEPICLAGVVRVEEIRLLSRVDVVALLVLLGESFCKDLVLEWILFLLPFKLELSPVFDLSLNIVKLFLGATLLLKVSGSVSSLLFFLKFFVKSLILVSVVPLSAARDFLEPRVPLSRSNTLPCETVFRSVVVVGLDNRSMRSSRAVLTGLRSLRPLGGSR